MFTAVHYNMLLVSLSMLVSMSNSLQFLRATTYAGALNQSGVGNGMEFTVYHAIDVTSIGVFDGDERGFNGSLSVRIFDRSTDRVVVGPVVVNSSDARIDDQNPFAFQNMTSVRLSPGVYSLIAIGSSAIDRWLNAREAPGSVVAGDSGDGAVLITNTIYGGNGLSASTPSGFSTGIFVAGATFLFEVVPRTAVTLPQPQYADCEAVACAGLSSGEYNIRGNARFCDNNESGGGWLRLWRANDTTCEANGWTSMRNVVAVGSDPPGCRPTTSCLGNRINAPYAFSEVRGSNWIVWALGTPDAFESPPPCEGVVIRDGNGSHVWALAAGNPTLRTALCPCDPMFTNSSFNWPNRVDAGDHWTCDRVPTQTGGAWTKLFDGTASFLCSSRTNATAGDLLSFQRVIESPQASLSVALCVDQSPTMEDLKLASGDLFVRATVGFDKTKHCPAIASTLSASTNTGADVASGSDDALWIIPTVIAVLLATVLCVLVVVWIWRNVRSKTDCQVLQNDIVAVSATSSNQYVGRLSEITPPRESPYGALSTREIGRN
jgi:hypothetical protein